MKKSLKHSFRIMCILILTIVIAQSSVFAVHSHTWATYYQSNGNYTHEVYCEQCGYYVASEDCVFDGVRVSDGNPEYHHQHCMYCEADSFLNVHVWNENTITNQLWMGHSLECMYCGEIVLFQHDVDNPCRCGYSW